MVKRVWRFGILAVGVCALVVVGYWLRSAIATAPAPEIQAVFPISSEIIGLEVQAGSLQHAQQTPYQAQVGDRREPESDQPDASIWLKRNQKVIGSLVGPDQDMLYGFDRLISQPLDTRWADNPLHYRLSSPDDTHYAIAQHPTAVFRKTKPSDRGRVGHHEIAWPLNHRLYLQLPMALRVGKTYRLELSGQKLPPQTWQYQPMEQWSEAIHVSQIGFRPDDPVKVAFLSTWLGSGGALTYPDDLSFTVINERSQTVAYRGQIQQTRTHREAEDARDRNYTLTNVYQMRFDDLDQAGYYRVCVADVGCSHAFQIGNNVWQEAFKLSMQGFYHQRSGIELTPPYSSQRRPRPFHPDDTPIVQSTTSLMATKMGIGPQDTFKVLAQTQTREAVPDAWGGYFDAGDWDRRIQHLEATRRFLELGELFPAYFADLALKLPETNNDRPDLLDEALWNLDFYRRLQQDDGGIRGGVESIAHPIRGEASWQNSLDTVVYAADPWSSYLYAGAAAQAATVLQAQFPELAQTYRQSAIAAMKYGETHPPDSLLERPFQINDARNLAAIELYRLTQDPAYHQIFLETTVFEQPDQLPQVWAKHHQADAAFLYARLPAAQVEPQIQTNARAALIKDADIAIQSGQQTAFKWSKDDPHQPLGWGGSLGTPKAVHLLRGHALTQDEKYLQAAVLAAQFSAGANPENLAYTTGLGDRSPQNPLVIDARIMAQAPPPGITVYGPLDPVRFKDYWMLRELQPHVFPDVYDWPTTESYFDVFLYPAVTEFTVMQTMAPTAYTWGYLAARS